MNALDAKAERDRQFWMAVRQALLAVLDALERWLLIAPRTSEMRHCYMREHGLAQPHRDGGEA